MDNASRARPLSARAGRWISTAGLVGLAVAFFLPHLGAKGNSSVLPARDFASELWFLFFPFYFAFGMLVVYFLRAVRRRGDTSRALSHAAAAVTVAMLSIYDGSCWWALTKGGLNSGQGDRLVLLSFTSSALIGTAVAVWIWIKVRPAMRPALLVSLFGLLSFVFFSPFTQNECLFGLWASIASSALLFIGGLTEFFGLRGDQDRLSAPSASS